MTDYPYYNWKHEPDDGEYELQFDRFESSADGDRYDLTIFLIIDTEKDLGEEGRFVGDVAYPTADISSTDLDEPNMTRIFHAIIKDSEIVEMTYKPEVSQQRHEEAQERLDRMHGNTDESNG
jgi:hypothetical protein